MDERGRSVSRAAVAIGVGEGMLPVGNLSGSAGGLTLDVTAGAIRLIEAALPRS